MAVKGRSRGRGRGRGAGASRRGSSAQQNRIARQRLWYGVRLVLGSSVLLAASVWLVINALDPQRLPVRHAYLYGELRYLDTAALRHLLKEYLGENFFTVNITELRSRLDRNPWLANVEISRQWPDGLRLRLHERRPIGHWANDELVDNSGYRFRPNNTDQLPKQPSWPRLNGPEGQAQVVVNAYRKVAMLVAPLGVRVATLRQDQRLAWHLTLDNGLQVVLSRDPNAESRFERELRRFIKVYPSVLAPQLERVVAVDMRHRNGFAVRWIKQRQSA